MEPKKLVKKPTRGVPLSSTKPKPKKAEKRVRKDVLWKNIALRPFRRYFYELLLSQMGMKIYEVRHVRDLTPFILHLLKKVNKLVTQTNSDIPTR
jgi:hypothetical protein